MNRDELIQFLAVAVRGPACPDRVANGLAMRGGGKDAMRPPTPDEWAAHVLEHAKALRRAVERYAEEHETAAMREQEALYERGTKAVQLAHEERRRREAMRVVSSVAAEPPAAPSESGGPTCASCGAEHDPPDYGSGDGCTQW
jgi:hypothetical protein